MSGKDGDDTIRISLYLIEYQKIKIPLSPAHWLLFLFSNDAKLGRVMSGKDGDGIIRISPYLIEYQKIKIPLKN